MMQEDETRNPADDGEPPPFLGTWNRLYAAVIIYTSVLILALHYDRDAQSLIPMHARLIVATYFAYVVTEGFRHGRKNRDIDDYFRGKRSLRWWAVGLSVMATQASAITYIGTTGQAYTAGMSFIQVYLPLPFAMIVLCMSFVPFFYRANVFTAYEYLERRFDAKTRSLPASSLSREDRGQLRPVRTIDNSSVIFGWNEIATIVPGASTILTPPSAEQSVIMIDANRCCSCLRGYSSPWPCSYTVSRQTDKADAVHLAGNWGD